MKKEIKTKKIINTILKIINNLLTYTFLIVSNIIFCIIYYILRVLKEVNFYELKFTLTNNLSGTGDEMITDGIKICFPLFILLAFIMIIPITKSKKTQIYIETKKRNINIYPLKLNKIKIIYALIILIVSIVALGKTIKYDKYLETINKTGDIYEVYYTDTNEVEITFPEKKRNLILLYLESMESSLASKESGGAFDISRIPELEILALNNLNFSNTDKIGGGYNLDLTAWTMASLWSTTTGTPLASNMSENYKNYEEYMPNVNALGDVLKKEGYNLEIIQGSVKEYAGVDKYYKTHGNYQIFDVKTAKERKYIDEDYSQWWGYEDKKLFEYAKKEIETLAQKEEPFAISIFTMDTHFVNGYLDSSCATNFKDQYSNVYACSSKMVNEFINWIKTEPFYENTTIVVIGDHLTMQNEYYDNYKDYERTIYNAFINTKTKPIKNKNRKFSSLDMYPTILASLGAKIKGEKLGFGVNLFGEEKTLIEELGKEKFNEEISKNSEYYNNKILKE